MARRLVTDSAAVSLAARELGKLCRQKRKAREDARNEARLAELEAENARLRALLGEKSSYSKSRITS
jgi:cell shape-determining protein MreC